MCKALAYHLAGLGHLSYDGVGPAGASPGFVVEAPPEPDAMVAVLPAPGFPADDLSGYETPELQVIVRTDQNAGHQQGWQLAENIRQALTHTAALTWGAGTEHEQEVLWCEGNEPSPVSLGRDDNHRPRWSVSFQLEALLEASPL